jgi:hypothetical protein
MMSGDRRKKGDCDSNGSGSGSEDGSSTTSGKDSRVTKKMVIAKAMEQQAENHQQMMEYLKNKDEADKDKMSCAARKIVMFHALAGEHDNDAAWIASAAGWLDQRGFL